MQNLAPQRQTLNHIRVLLRMIVAQTRPALPAPYRQTRLLVAGMRRMEVLLQIRNHPIARISVRPQERVIVADAVQALADLLLRERAAVVLAREGLDGAFFRLDVPLDLAPCAALGVDLLGGHGDEVVAEELERVVFFVFVLTVSGAALRDVVRELRRIVVLIFVTFTFIISNFVQAEPPASDTGLLALSDSIETCVKACGPSAATLVRVLPSLRYVFLRTSGSLTERDLAVAPPWRASAKHERWDVSRAWRVPRHAYASGGANPNHGAQVEDGSAETNVDLSLVELHGDVADTIVRNEDLVLSETEGETASPLCSGCWRPSGRACCCCCCCWWTRCCWSWGWACGGRPSSWPGALRADMIWLRLRS